MIIPLWITIALHALYYFWSVIELTALAHTAWHNSNPYWIKVYGKMNYTKTGIKCSLVYVIVTVFYISYYFNG